MKIKLLILISIMISGFFNLKAQDIIKESTKMEGSNLILNSRYIKFSPLHLLELEPTLMIGYEYPFKSIRLQHELGYTALFNPVYGLFQWDATFTEMESYGIKARTTIKFPLAIDHPKRAMRYFGIDFMYKYLAFTERDVNIHRMNAYWEIIDVTTSKHVAAIHFIYGSSNFVSRDNNIVHDWYFGGGLRFKTIGNDAPEEIERNYPFYDEFTGPMISIMLGIKFGFGLP